MENNKTVQNQGLVHERIALLAAASPATLAVRDEKRQISFGEFNERANRLARHLQTLGVQLETPVGLLFERTLDFVVAALAVWKAGGCYVPLDPAYPPGRIDSILKDAAVPVLLSHKWMAASLPGGPWKVVDLDVDARLIAQQSPEPLDVAVSPQNLAYIAYTSGSTGRPKGVEVTHGNLCHLVDWHTNAFQVTPADRASQIAGLAFDAAVWEMWCHLAAGASLHMIDETNRRSPEGLKDWLLQQKIAIAFVPTVMAEHLLTLDWPNRADLRILLTGADTLHRYPRAGLPFTLVNNYGPTECTVLVTSGVVSPQEHASRLPTIGHPIGGMTVVILDSDLKPVPAGGEGEICVMGPQVARGYRNLPEITSQKFVSEPVSGRRLYRTGDRGMLLPSGEIAFLGRIDDQIKIRGYRVEPDEIVAQLNGHSGVANSVVVARGEEPGGKSLVAYIVPNAAEPIAADDLRRHLRLRVPDYMIPAAFVKLAHLPLAANGKCDKQALPEPGPSNLFLESNLKAAQPFEGNPTEARLIELLSGLMGGRPISRDDNFFLVGGHSMLAAQLLARIREAMAVTLNLRQLFQAPTIAQLAVIVEQKLAAK